MSGEGEGAGGEKPGCRRPGRAGDVHKAPKAGKIQGEAVRTHRTRVYDGAKRGGAASRPPAAERKSQRVAGQPEEVGRGETRRHSRATTNQCRHSATCASTAHDGGRAAATQEGTESTEGKERERGEREGKGAVAAREQAREAKHSSTSLLRQGRKL